MCGSFPPLFVPVDQKDHIEQVVGESEAGAWFRSCLTRFSRRFRLREARFDEFTLMASVGAISAAHRASLGLKVHLCYTQDLPVPALSMRTRPGSRIAFL